jgi:hypothetical protein
MATSIDTRPDARAPSLPAARAAIDRGVLPGPHAGQAGQSDEIRRIQTITRWLDDRYIDPILGFVAPGVGDTLTAAFGLYVLVAAARQRVPPVVLARMIMNLALDVLVGAIPVLGDLFDFAYKAHKRNAALLIERHGQTRGTARDWLLVAGAALLLLAVLVIPIVLLVWAVMGIRDLIFS